MQTRTFNSLFNYKEFTCLNYSSRENLNKLISCTGSTLANSKTLCFLFSVHVKTQKQTFHWRDSLKVKVTGKCIQMILF